MSGKTIALIVVSMLAFTSEIIGAKIPSFCKTAPVIYEAGVLNATRWGFFPDTNKCSRFKALYYAIGGNNFMTREDCLKTCSKRDHITYVPVDGDFRCKCWKPVLETGSTVTTTEASTTEAVTTSKPWWNPFGR